MTQKNTLDLYRTPVDIELAKLSKEDRLQLIIDHDELERTGRNGDTLLRHHAGLIYRKLEMRDYGFNSLYMSLVGSAAHKLNSLDMLEASQESDLEATDQQVLALHLLRDMLKDEAALKADPAAALDDLLDRARTILSTPQAEISEEPGL